MLHVPVLCDFLRMVADWLHIASSPPCFRGSLHPPPHICGPVLLCSVLAASHVHVVYLCEHSQYSHQCDLVGSA